MSNGFPDGKFCIINEDTGHYLAALPGGTTIGSQWERDWLEGARETVVYTHTKDQVLGLATEPSGKNYERWFFDDEKNSWGYEFFHLVNCAKDIRSWFTLAAPLEPVFYRRSRYADVPGEIADAYLKGRGQEGQVQWKAADGMLYPADLNKVLTLAPVGDDRYRVVLADPGAPRQKWRFVTDS